MIQKKGCRIGHLFYLLCLMMFLNSLVGCAPDPENSQRDASDPELFHQAMKQLTDVIVYDIFSPPAASRVYAYPSIAAYEVLQYAYPEYQSLSGQLTGFSGIPAPDPDVTYCYPLAAVKAFLTVGRQLIFSDDQILAYEQEILQQFQEMGIPSAVYQRSLTYGEKAAGATLQWAAVDGYATTRTYPKHPVREDDPASWQPTPPGYMDGIEPHWREIRPFVLDSADQFVPAPPTPFDTTKGSLFHRELMEVYQALDHPDKRERVAIAEFWDCNPYVSHQVGHVMYATKKITPGGHWINIAGIACRKAEANLMQSVATYTLTSIALADAFISCWDEKYRSNLIRPETVINRYYDESWRPALQTPPFPEHTSGHSVISRAAAVALTALFGDSFAFLDTSEEEYGLPARSFSSFLQASEEAAISRLYGGIHYRPAIDEGLRQGELVGRYVVQNIKMRVLLSERDPNRPGQ